MAPSVLFVDDDRNLCQIVAKSPARRGLRGPDGVRRRVGAEPRSRKIRPICCCSTCSCRARTASRCSSRSARWRRRSAHCRPCCSRAARRRPPTAKRARGARRRRARWSKPVPLERLLEIVVGHARRGQAAGRAASSRRLGRHAAAAAHDHLGSRSIAFPSRPCCTTCTACAPPACSTSRPRRSASGSSCATAIPSRCARTWCARRSGTSSSAPGASRAPCSRSRAARWSSTRAVRARCWWRCRCSPRSGWRTRCAIRPTRSSSRSSPGRPGASTSSAAPSSSARTCSGSVAAPRT